MNTSTYVSGVTTAPDIYAEPPEEREEREYDPARLERMERRMRYLEEVRRAQILRGGGDDN